MQNLRKLAVAAATVLLVFVGITWWAAEWDGVLVVTTRTADASPRETHIWYVRQGDRLWLEAGLPDNPWYVDIQRDARVKLEGDDVSGEFVLSSVPGRQAAEHVRSLMRQKYGLRDRWILFFVDGSRTTAVLASPADSTAPTS